MEQLTPRALRRLHLETRIAMGGATGRIAQRDLDAMDREDKETLSIDESGEAVLPEEICEFHGVHFGSIKCVHCSLASNSLMEQEETWEQSTTGKSESDPLK